MLLLILFSYTIPFDSPLMDNIEYLQVKGFIDFPSIRPYEIEWFIPQLDELLVNEKNLNKIDRRFIKLFNPLLVKDPDFSYLGHLAMTYQKEPNLRYGFIDSRLGGHLADNISYAEAIRVRRGSEFDNLGPKPWKDFQAYLNEGFIKFNLDMIKFYIGRRNFLLTHVSDHSLLLSPDPQGYDGFLLLIPGKHYEFYNIFTVLDASKNRYISIHRIGVNLKKFLKLGFSEAILYGNTLEPLYLNPFLPYYFAQWGINRDDNIMWSFDLEVMFLKSIFYAELLIDDYMYENDDYPSKLAYQCGLKSLIFNSFMVKMNYTFVDKWVYTHHEQINTYERNGHPLGFPLGNDVDDLSLSIKFLNQYGLYPSLVLNYTRKGEGTIFLPFEKEGGTWTPPFPSGIVERKLDVILAFDYTLRYNFYMKVGMGKRFWYNYNHIVSDNRNDLILNFSLWVIM